MAGRYTEYPEYKSTDEVWLGNIPANWKVVQIKYIADSVNTGGTPKELSSFTEEPEVFWFSPSDFHNGHSLEKANKYVTWRSVNSKDSKIYRANSVLVIGIGATLGKVAHCSKAFSCNQQINVISPNSNVNSFFLMYSLSVQSEQIIQSSNASTIGIMNQEKTKDIAIALPTNKEQQKIASFLDHETAKIDTLIAKQEKLIELLKEKRQAVISHAVTKGLNPNAPMRDSDVEWLGEVPEHWSVIPNKRLFELTPKKSQIESRKKELCNFIPMDKLKQDYLALDEERLISTVFDGYTYFEDGDVLMAKVTPCFENKNMVVARGLKNGIGFGSSEIYVLRCNSKVSNDFIYYRLQEDTFMNIATAAMTGAGGLKRVPADMIMNFILALPPLEEQLKIVEALKEKLAVLDELSIKAFNAINLIKERKVALISAAVTGKIDVRDFVSEQGQPQGVQG